ncbi:hypothetical protein RPALISO_220 [Ruegeria phage RpAliso]|nr:hypothetical protein RPALISO_220 [Ruegeria phage RpAliso]
MAWVFPEERQCPSCGHRERTLVTQTRSGFRLSCGWCAKLSDEMDAQRAFFKAWGAPRKQVGAILNLEGVPYWFKGEYIESVPITVILSAHSALVTERKEVA